MEPKRRRRFAGCKQRDVRNQIQKIATKGGYSVQVQDALEFNQHYHLERWRKSFGGQFERHKRHRA